MSNDQEHAELLGALRGETCDEASRGRMRDKLAAAGILSASAATAGTAATALANAAPAKAGLFKLLTASKLLGGGALLAAGTAVVVSLSAPAERAAPRRTPTMQAAQPPAPVAPVVEAPVVEEKAEPAPPPRKHPRPSARANDTLARESALLTGAARRLHAGDLDGARRMLDEHERSFPQGVLRTERELARQRVQNELRAREAP
jgi:hypothetical protein